MTRAGQMQLPLVQDVPPEDHPCYVKTYRKQFHRAPDSGRCGELMYCARCGVEIDDQVKAVKA